MRSYSCFIWMLITWVLLLSTLLDFNEGMADAMAKKVIKVHVSILPQKYFVERIGGDKVDVTVLVNPGKNPATYSPTPVQIQNLASSDIYFSIGVPFENGFMHKIKSIAGSIQVVDTHQGIQLRDMDDHDEDVKDSSGQSHHHLGKDPHIWMNPVLVKIMAGTIFRVLVKMDPLNQGEYENNYHHFCKELDGLDKVLKASLEGLKGESLFVFHPSFGYFTDRYGLKQVAVEVMGKSPKGKQLFAIIKLAKREKTRVIFVQPQFNQQAAEKIASAINGSVLPIDPLAYDYLFNMRSLAKTLAAKLKP